MARADLIALAERCEVEEPSRELDAAIFIAVHIDADNTQRIDQDGGVVGWWPFNKPYVAAREVPAVTTSLDAAAMLEPDDAQEICVRRYRDGNAYVRITLANGQPVYSAEFDKPIGEPRARCAAALRALAAMAQDATAPDLG